MYLSSICVSGKEREMMSKHARNYSDEFGYYPKSKPEKWVEFEGLFSFFCHFFFINLAKNEETFKTQISSI